MVKATKLTTSTEIVAAAETAIAEGDILFLPSPLHQQLKAQFWARFEPGPLGDSRNLTLAVIQSVISDPRLKQYWALPGFKEWFSNHDENRERLEYLFSVALNSAEQILLDPGANASAKVNLIKLLAEITNRLPRSGGGKNDDRFADDLVNKMTEDELKQWLRKKGATVKATYQVKPSEESF